MWVKANGLPSDQGDSQLGLVWGGGEECLREEGRREKVVYVLEVLETCWETEFSSVTVSVQQTLGPRSFQLMAPSPKSGPDSEPRSPHEVQGHGVQE